MGGNDKDNDGKIEIEINSVDDSSDENLENDQQSENNVWELDEADDLLEEQVADLGGDMEFETDDEEEDENNWKTMYEKKKADIGKLKEHLLRLAADFDNFRKRAAKEKDDLVKSCNDALLLEILPIKDDLERAIEVSQEKHEFSTLLEGIELVLSNFNKVLEKNGLIEISAVGEKFDPNLHDALTRVESTEMDDNTVVQEYKKGYMLNDKLLRPAQVVVSLNPDDENKK